MIKKLILIIGILNGIVLSSKVYGQVITVDLVDTKKLLFEKGEDYISFLCDPTNAIAGGIDVYKDCKYVFDIENEQWNFFKNGEEYGFVPTHSISEKNGVYTITYKENGLPPYQHLTVTQTFTIDTNKNYFVSAHCDKENQYIKVQIPKQYSIKIN